MRLGHRPGELGATEPVREAERARAGSVERLVLERLPGLFPPVEPLVRAAAGEARRTLDAVRSRRARGRGGIAVERNPGDSQRRADRDRRDQHRSRAPLHPRRGIDALREPRESDDDESRDDDGDEKQAAVVDPHGVRLEVVAHAV